MGSHREAVHQGLETITYSTIAFIEAARETGIAGIFYAIQHNRNGGPTQAEGLAHVTGAVSGGVSRWRLYRDNPETALAEVADALARTGGRRGRF